MFENIPSNLPTSKEPEDIFSKGPKSGGGGAGASTPQPSVTPSSSRPAAPSPLRSMAPQGVQPAPRPSQITPETPKPPIAPPSTARPAAPAPAPLLQQRGPVAPPPVMLEKPSRSWVRVVLVLIVLGVLGAGGYFFISKGGLDLIFKKKIIAEPQAPQPQIPINAQLPPPPIAETEQVPAPEVVSPPPPSIAVDSDGDGLTDEEEASLSTDSLKADSDEDGLLDNEEVRIYKSNPMFPDTDGDGYTDGEEVKNGYNPIGTGRLFQVPTQ